MPKLRPDIEPLFQLLGLPPMEAWKLEASAYLKSATIRVSEIRPTGYVHVYSVPYRGMPARFDSEHSEQRVETASPFIWIHKMDGAESFKLALVSFEHDAEAERKAQEPQPLDFGGLSEWQARLWRDRI